MLNIQWKESRRKSYTCTQHILSELYCKSHTLAIVFYLSWRLSSVIIHCSCYISVCIFTFWYVISSKYTHAALRKQSRSSSEFVCILKILRKQSATHGEWRNTQIWCEVILMRCVYAFTGKRRNNLICFSFQFVFLFVRFFGVVIFRFDFFSFLLFYILFLCSVLFFSLWFSVFLIVVGIVLYTEGIFNNNGK